MSRDSTRPPPSPRGVIFDVGNVLIQLRPLDRVLRELAAAGSAAGDRTPGARPAGPSALDPMAALRSNPVLDRLERGRASEREFCDAVRAVFGAGLSDQAIRRVYEAVLGDPMPGMAELVTDLRARGVGAVGLTDISPGHLTLIRRYPAVAALQAVVASCETTHRKPEPGAYRAALDALGTAPEETVFVDDQPANIEGARRVGIRGTVFSGAEELRSFLGIGGR